MVILIYRNERTTEKKLECGRMPNVMAALPNIGVAPSAQRHKVWLTPSARVTRSNAANIGEGKILTQSEFCSWQNSVRGKSHRKCIYSIPAEETAKHCAKFD